MNEGFALKTAYPAYPLTRIYLPNILLGFADYHSGMLWPWISCFYAVALQKYDKKEAVKTLEKISSKIIEYQNCYEVYEQNGKPVKRWFYKSEKPFAWFAGSFIYAFHAVMK